VRLEKPYIHATKTENYNKSLCQNAAETIEDNSQQWSLDLVNPAHIMSFIPSKVQ